MSTAQAVTVEDLLDQLSVMKDFVEVDELLIRYRGPLVCVYSGQNKVWLCKLEHPFEHSVFTSHAKDALRLRRSQAPEDKDFVYVRAESVEVFLRSIVTEETEELVA